MNRIFLSHPAGGQPARGCPCDRVQRHVRHALQLFVRSGMLLGAAAWQLPVSAEPIVLSDLNSQVTIDPEADGGPAAGATSWRVDGVNQLQQQWFWYRVGPEGPELPLGGLPYVVNLSDGDLDPGAERTVIRYTAESQFTADVDLTVTGGAPGSGKSDLQEVIAIHNTSTQPLDFHFFQYSHFRLGGTADDTVQISGGNTARQSDGVMNFSETVVTPAPTASEVAFASATRDKLNDAAPDALDGSIGPVGPGDVTWAFQWSKVIPPGGSLLISKDKGLAVVPEPGSSVLLAVGAALWAVFGLRRRQRA